MFHLLLLLFIILVKIFLSFNYIWRFFCKNILTNCLTLWPHRDREPRDGTNIFLSPPLPLFIATFLYVSSNPKTWQPISSIHLKHLLIKLKKNFFKSPLFNLYLNLSIICWLTRITSESLLTQKRLIVCKVEAFINQSISEVTKNKSIGRCTKTGQHASNYSAEDEKKIQAIREAKLQKNITHFGILSTFPTQQENASESSPRSWQINSSSALNNQLIYQINCSDHAKLFPVQIWDTVFSSFHGLDRWI